MAKKMMWAGPFFVGELPPQAVADCTSQGRVDESVEYWVGKTGFYVPGEDMAREYLVRTGRDPDEIEAAEMCDVAGQVFWDLCHALKKGDPFSLTD